MNSSRFRTVRGLLVVGFAFALLVALEIFTRFLLEGSVVDGPRQMIQVTIPGGASTAEIARLLHDRGLIEHPLLFRYAARLMGADTRIQAGSTMLASGQSLFELIRNLMRTKALGIPVTFREGVTTMTIAGVLAEKLGVDSASFVAVARDTGFIRSLGLDVASLEGYLYPDTYFLSPQTGPRRIASRMLANFRAHLPKDADARASAMGFTLHEIITMASIVEWETVQPREARIIASVYYNRLKRGMPLQADPTISYALGKGPSRLYYRDLRIDSPYNTYLYPGLPPGPINNPSRQSIEAALSPESTTYLFFVSRGDGTHTFSATLSDHLTAKQHLDRLRRESTRMDTVTSG